MNIEKAAKDLGVGVSVLEAKLSQYGLTEKDLTSATMGDLAQEFKAGAIQPTGTAAPTTPAPKPAPTPAPTSAPAPTQPVPKTPAPTTLAEVQARKQAAMVAAATTAERSQTRIYELAALKLEQALAPTEESTAEALAQRWLMENQEELGKLTARLGQYREQSMMGALRVIEVDAIDVLALPAGV